MITLFFIGLCGDEAEHYVFASTSGIIQEKTAVIPEALKIPAVHMLSRAEYVEQAHFFRALSERIRQSLPIQEVLGGLRHECLATTKLPLAVDYMLSEIRHQGAFAPAMARLNHYFAPFQSYLAMEAENDQGRFDTRLAFDILHLEAKYRSEKLTQQGLFLYQFETLCRHRLNYDRGLSAIADDPVFDKAWKDWILIVRRQIGIVDFADMVYVRSQFFQQRQEHRPSSTRVSPEQILFGEAEGKIAWANRQKDPLFLFSALQRHLGYPCVPRPEAIDQSADLLPNMMRRLDRLETRMKLLEEEQRQGIDITKFYGRPQS